MTVGLRSIDLVLDEMRSARQDQMAHFDALDAKAGVLLGFSGVLVALGLQVQSPVTLVGVVCAALATLFSVSVYWPRKLAKLQAAVLREKYLTEDPSFTKLRLLDTGIEMWLQTTLVLHKKALRIKTSSGLLATAICVLAFGAIESNL